MHTNESGSGYVACARRPVECRKREWRLKFDELDRSFEGTRNDRKRVITFVNFELVFDSMVTAKV